MNQETAVIDQRADREYLLQQLSIHSHADSNDKNGHGQYHDRQNDDENDSENLEIGLQACDPFSEITLIQIIDCRGCFSCKPVEENIDDDADGGHDHRNHNHH